MKKLILFITTSLTLLSFTVTTYAETPKQTMFPHIPLYVEMVEFPK